MARGGRAPQKAGPTPLKALVFTKKNKLRKHDEGKKSCVVAEELDGGVVVREAEAVQKREFVQPVVPKKATKKMTNLQDLQVPLLPEISQLPLDSCRLTWVEVGEGERRLEALLALVRARLRANDRIIIPCSTTSGCVFLREVLDRAEICDISKIAITRRGAIIEGLLHPEAATLELPPFQPGGVVPPRPWAVEGVEKVLKKRQETESKYLKEATIILFGAEMSPQFANQLYNGKIDIAPVEQLKDKGLCVIHYDIIESVESYAGLLRALAAHGGTASILSILCVRECERPIVELLNQQLEKPHDEATPARRFTAGDALLKLHQLNRKTFSLYLAGYLAYRAHMTRYYASSLRHIYDVYKNHPDLALAASMFLQDRPSRLEFLGLKARAVRYHKVTASRNAKKWKDYFDDFYSKIREREL